MRLTAASVTTRISSDGSKEKKIWHDQPRRGDKNVKAPNQIKARFAELFPKINWHKETQETARKGQIYLSGISISEPIGEASEPMVSQSVRQQSALHKDSEAVSQLSYTQGEILSMVQVLPKNERRELILALMAEEGITASLPHQLPHQLTLLH